MELVPRALTMELTALLALVMAAVGVIRMIDALAFACRMMNALARVPSRQAVSLMKLTESSTLRTRTFPAEPSVSVTDETRSLTCLYISMPKRNASSDMEETVSARLRAAVTALDAMSSRLGSASAADRATEATRLTVDVIAATTSSTERPKIIARDTLSTSDPMASTAARGIDPTLETDSVTELTVSATLRTRLTTPLVTSPTTDSTIDPTDWAMVRTVESTLVTPSPMVPMVSAMDRCTVPSDLAAASEIPAMASDMDRVASRAPRATVSTMDPMDSLADRVTEDVLVTASVKNGRDWAADRMAATVLATASEMGPVTSSTDLETDMADRARASETVLTLSATVLTMSPPAPWNTASSMVPM